MELNKSSNDQTIKNANIPYYNTQILGKSQDDAEYKTSVADIVVGDIIKGEVIDSINNLLKLVTESGEEISAKFQHTNNSLNIGDIASFTVQSIHNSVISLAFIAEDTDKQNPAVDKALMEANLSPTPKNIQIVEELLKNNLSINKETLQNLVKQSHVYKELSINELIIIHKNKMPFNEKTVNQIISYKNNSHQLINEFNSVKEELLNLVTSNNKVLYNETDKNNQLLNTEIDKDKQPLSLQIDNNEYISNLKEVNIEIIKVLLNENINNNNLTVDKSFIESMIQMDNEEFVKLIQSKDYNHILDKIINNRWAITPEDISKENLVSNKYNELVKDLDLIKKIVTKIDNNISKEIDNKIENINNNIDFIKLINNFFDYVQLPLNLEEEMAHADLYIYKNKTTTKEDDKKFRLLLHLEMPSLGDTNIHMTIDKSNIYTQFFIEDDFSRQLITKNLSLLKEALLNHGYSFIGEVKESYKPIDFFDNILNHNNSTNDITRYSFDIRA
ncbi:MAG TPA: flagellar hook-length control protein FliK [Clostridiales bacterium]|nr:flagellar hook-length control protein FliK [Clostridiales bacterium]